MIKVLTIMTTKIGTSGISEIVLRYYKYVNKENIKIDFIVPNEPSKDIIELFKKNNTSYYVIKGRKKIFKYYKELKKIIKEQKYDIVHVHGNSATMAIEMHAAKSAGCKNRIAHTHNTKISYGLADKIFRPIFYKDVTTCFACGEEAGKNLYKNRKFYVIPNGNALEKYKFDINQRKKYRVQYKIKENEILIGHVGRFNEQKNHEYIIKILKKLKDNENIKLLLIGSGAKEKEIKEEVNRIAELKDRVTFTGEIKNVNELINACDIMVLPSRYEGFPVVAIEWQANGLPIIASNKISKEIDKTHSVTFLKIEDKDIEEWSEKIKKIEFKEDERKEKSRNNCKILKEKGFDIKDDAENLRKKYEKLAKENLK